MSILSKGMSILSKGGITEELSNRIVKIDFNDIPKDVIAISKKAILDGIGVAIAGSTDQASNIICDFVKEINGKKISTVILKPFKTTPILAALANGTMMHSLDYDDTNWKGVLHPTTVILPSILSLGEEKNINGQGILTAYVLGVETEIKLARGVFPSHYNQGWHPTSSLGTIGAAVATGKILKLNKEELCNSIGIAVSQVAGIMANQGSMTKPFHAGKAAFNGMMASILAKKGLTANKNILEDGFVKVFGEIEENDLDVNIRNFGNPFEITLSGISIKRYPCCASIHPAIDGILKLMKNNVIRPKYIKKIECILHPRRMATINRPHISSALEGKFSTQYCIAMAILENKVDLDTFSNDRFPFDVNIREMMNKIEVKGYPYFTNNVKEEVDTLATEVKIKLYDEKEYSESVQKIKVLGPSISIEDDIEIIDKFKNCCNGILGKNIVKKLIKQIDEFENIDNIGKFMNFFRIKYLEKNTKINAQ